MTMRLIIAGGRDYVFKQSDYDKLDNIISEGYQIGEVVSGACKTFDSDNNPQGADYFGECWANFHHIPIMRFPADWKKYGHAAGPIRNEEMAKYSDGLALFPGGRGTEHMWKMAVKHKLSYMWDFRT